MIRVNLDVMLALRKRRGKDLARAIGLSEQNLSALRQGRVKGVRFATLSAICRELDCRPGDILEYVPGGEEDEEEAGTDQPPE